MKDNHRSGPLDASALHLLHRAGQCAEVLFTNETAKSDLTPRQYAVLVCVGQNPDVSQTGLVEQTGVDRSTLADVVRRLVKKGLLQRKRTKRDARMYAVRLTAKGQNILSSVKPQATKVDQRILAVLRSDQRGNFIDALGDIVRAMRAGRRLRKGGRRPDTLHQALGVRLVPPCFVRAGPFQSGKARPTMAPVSAASRPWP